MSSRTADLALRGGVSPQYGLWRRRSRQIKFYRRALPAFIVAILAILAGWVLYNTVAWRFASGKDTDGVSIRMVNPKFYGRDSSNSPYLISAKSATRDERDFQRVVLDHPRFVNDLGTVTQTTITAQDGVYREDTRVLRLEKDVVVIDKRGYSFKTQRAVVDTRSGVIDGKSPIEGVGPLGRIAASSYAVEDGGDRVIFRGNVRMRIDRPAR